MSEEELLVEQRGAILLLRLNRPEARNALSPSLLGSFGAALATAETDPETRVVVVTGAGNEVFCAGMDLRAFAEGGSGLGDGEDAQAVLRFFRGTIEVPIIGAANGTAVGGGLEILLGCDLIVLAEHARLGLPEVKRGFFAAGGGTFLGTRIPLSIALEMTLTGDSIDAERAFAVGLANAVAPIERLLEVALEYAGRIAANAPLGVKASKELVRLATVDAPAARDRLAELQPLVFGSEDAKEGARAFIERRDPSWTGR
jgi:enoyl-CoA hydratase/carnithine racemase